MRNLEISPNMKKRIKNVIAMAVAVLFVGILYSAFYIYNGFGFPCIFNSITGFLCPGCGVSAMCISLMKLDFKSAFHYNPAIMIALPILIFLCISVLRNYIKKGKCTLSKAENRIAWVMVVYFLTYGFMRNIR